VKLDISLLSGPLLVAWQLTRRCDLACAHCCTSSSGSRSRDELSGPDAARLASDIAACRVPYVLLCGGEPMLSPHFWNVAERLGSAGVELKVESNGQGLGKREADRLARLPMRSVQISLDADAQDVYARLRPGASLEKAWAACRAVRAAGIPLEVSFVPVRFNAHQAEAVMERAAALGAFRFNTGALMPLGRARRAWARLTPGPSQYEGLRALLRRKQGDFAGSMELCYVPFTILEGLEAARSSPPATLLILPDGRVQVSAALPYVCADLRRQGLFEAWERYRAAWKHGAVLEAAARTVREPSRLSEAEEPRALDEIVVSGAA